MVKSNFTSYEVTTQIMKTLFDCGIKKLFRIQFNMLEKKIKKGEKEWKKYYSSYLKSLI